MIRKFHQRNHHGQPSLVNWQIVAFIAAFCFVTQAAFAQSPWQTFPDARLIADSARDGDSFTVEIEREGRKEQHTLRLYFVDAPESGASADADRRRVVEQMRYFGVQSPAVLLESGTQAAELTRQLLEKPFTVFTSFATAPGRSSKPRIYALVKTSDGRDLGSVLVESGLARARGVARSLPDGTPAGEAQAAMSDREAAAMLARRGLWQHSDAARIAELRAAEREEARKLRDLFRETTAEAGKVNLNTAGQNELQKLKGIGRVLSQRIIDHRPYASVDDLLRVPGISADLFDSLREQLSVGENTAEND